MIIDKVIYLSPVPSPCTKQYSFSPELYENFATMVLSWKKLTSIVRMLTDTRNSTKIIVLPNDLAPNRHMIKQIVVTMEV